VKADRCDIYTDVDGVYTTDPRIVSRARKLDKVTYEEMLELASVGSKVLQTRSVARDEGKGARAGAVSSFDEPPNAPTIPGTMIVGEEEWRRKRHGTSAHHRHRRRQERGEGHRDARARQARRGRQHLRARSPMPASTST
jgi:aspartate kinase